MMTLLWPAPASAVISKINVFNSSDRCALFLVSSTPALTGMDIQRRVIQVGGQASFTPQAKYGPTLGAYRITVEARVYESVRDCVNNGNSGGNSGGSFIRVSGSKNRIPMSKIVTWNARLIGSKGHYRINL